MIKINIWLALSVFYPKSKVSSYFFLQLFYDKRFSEINLR